MSRRALSAAVAALVCAGLVVGPAGHAGAGPVAQHRAAVIVDTGTTVHKVVITFTEDSITGIDALQRAHADPVIYSFNGQGGAVCRLFGVGRDAGSSCLGGQDGDARYWAYFRAPAGASSFTYSSIGAGAARVHDGDVEGWKFATGAAPQFVPLSSLVAAQDPPATSLPAQAPVTPSGPGAAGGSTPVGGSAARGSQGLADAATSVSTLPVAGATGSTPSATGSEAVSGATRATGASGTTGDHRASKHRGTAETALASSKSDAGNSASSLIWFAVLLAVIVVAILVARRVRRRSAVRPT